MTAIRILTLCTVLFLTGMTGCTKETSDNPQQPEKKAISFDAAITGHYTDKKNSKSAAYIEGNTFSIGDQIGVLGFAVPGGTWLGTETPSLMYNSALEKIDTETFRYNPMVGWPTMGKASFFAYYPYSNFVTHGITTPSPISQRGYPAVTVVLGKSHEPIDFMTAQQELINYASSNQGAVKFQFKHRLSKIRFQARFTNTDSEINLYINTIKIRNIYNKAVYTFMSAGSGDGKWSDYGNESTVDALSGATLNINSSSSAVGNDYTDLIFPTQTEAYTLMLPQTYPNSELEVGYMIENIKLAGGCEYHIYGTKTLPISVNWETGQVYTYKFEFAFSEVLGINVNVDVINSNADWDKEDIGTDIGK